jgi:hypothetical protein
MVCDILNILFFNKLKRKQFWYTHELMCVLNHFRLFAIRLNPDPKPFHLTAHFKKKKRTTKKIIKVVEVDEDMNPAGPVETEEADEFEEFEEFEEIEEPEPLDPTIAHIYS